MKTKVINILGGSGIGKSTVASEIFVYLKRKGCDVEFVAEYAKEWANIQKPVGVFGQAILYGQQLKRESALYGKFEYVITESPLILSAVYQKFYLENDPITYQVMFDLANASKCGVEHINVLLERVDLFKFHEKGRFETVHVAKLVDAAVKDMLDDLDQPYITCRPWAEEIIKVLEL